jgi:hypothetical protein
MSTKPNRGTAEDAVSRLRTLCDSKGWRIIAQVRMPPIKDEHLPEQLGDKFVQRPKEEPLGSGVLIAVDFGRMSPEEKLLLAIFFPEDFNGFENAGIRRLLQFKGVEGYEITRQLEQSGTATLRFTLHALVSRSSLGHRRNVVTYTPILFKRAEGWFFGYLATKNAVEPIAFFFEDP